MPKEIELTLYSKHDCPLCDEMMEVIRRAGAVVPLNVALRDITGDPDLLLRYGSDIPVLEHDGKTVAKHRAHPATLIAKLRKL